MSQVRALGLRSGRVCRQAALVHFANSPFEQHSGTQGDDCDQIDAQGEFHPRERTLPWDGRVVTAEGAAVQHVENSQMTYDISYNHCRQPIGYVGLVELPHDTGAKARSNAEFTDHDERNHRPGLGGLLRNE